MSAFDYWEISSSKSIGSKASLCAVRGNSILGFSCNAFFFFPRVPVGIWHFSAGYSSSTFPLKLRYLFSFPLPTPSPQLSPVFHFSWRTLSFTCIPLCIPPSSRRSWRVSPPLLPTSFAPLTAHCTFPPGSHVHPQLLSDYPCAGLLSPVVCVCDHPIAHGACLFLFAKGISMWDVLWVSSSCCDPSVARGLDVSACSLCCVWLSKELKALTHLWWYLFKVVDSDLWIIFLFFFPKDGASIAPAAWTCFCAG